MNYFFDDLPYLADCLVDSPPVSVLALGAAVPHGEAAAALLGGVLLAARSGAPVEVPARRLLLASPRLLAGCLGEFGEDLQGPGVGGAEGEGRNIIDISDEGVRPVLQQEGHQVEVLAVRGQQQGSGAKPILLELVSQRSPLPSAAPWRSSGYRHCETLQHSRCEEE